MIGFAGGNTTINASLAIVNCLILCPASNASCNSEALGALLIGAKSAVPSSNASNPAPEPGPSVANCTSGCISPHLACASAIIGNTVFDPIIDKFPFND